MPPHARRIKVGLLANEFFDPALGRMGGFGMLALQVATLFHDHPELGFDVVFLSGEHYGNGQQETISHHTRLLFQQHDRQQYRRTVRAEKFDVFFTIDYRPGYRWALDALRRTPIIVWVQDPKPPADMEKIRTLRMPGLADAPQGVGAPNCTSLAQVVGRSRWFWRKVVFAAPALFLHEKAPATYGLPIRHLEFLPYILDSKLPETIEKSPRPSVVFLSRLDPVKRPWVVAELARWFPQVDFLFMGQSYVHGPGSWQPSAEQLPRNVSLLGHIDGPQKLSLLTSAWVLINTSIHDGLPVSFLESLLYETPILSCQDPDGIVSRFGAYVGRFDGDGMQSLPAFRDALERLLSDHDWRRRCGQEGRQWVEQTHNSERFLASFRKLCQDAGARLPA